MKQKSGPVGYVFRKVFCSSAEKNGHLPSRRCPTSRTTRLSGRLLRKGPVRWAPALAQLYRRGVIPSVLASEHGTGKGGERLEGFMHPRA